MCAAQGGRAPRPSAAGRLAGASRAQRTAATPTRAAAGRADLASCGTRQAAAPAGDDAVQPEGRVPRRVGPPAHMVRQPAPVRQAEQRRAGERRRRGLALQRQQRGGGQHGQRRPAQARQHAAPAGPRGGLWGRLAPPAAIQFGAALREVSVRAGSPPRCASPAHAARYVFAPRETPGRPAALDLLVHACTHTLQVTAMQCLLAPKAV